MAIDQWASAVPFFGTSNPGGVTADDAKRLQAYSLYEGMYWNVPDVYKIVNRSEDSRPIYLPTPRKIIDACHRFLAVDWDFLVHPKVGTVDDQNLVKGLLSKLFKRELMYAKFSTQKRNGLIRGDALWHITADPSKGDGERISVHELDPSQYFPIRDRTTDKVTGCYIVDTIPNPADITQQVSRRQAYRKADDGTITTELILFDLNRWDDRLPDQETSIVQVVRPMEALPDSITALPVYHIQNLRTSGVWGSSEVRGVETVMAAVSQAVSDEDLAISLQGLGVYWTDGGPPRDSEGNESAFIMGPGDVVEVAPGSNFNRVSGISGSLPGIEHMNFMMDQADLALGTPAIAQGRVEVSVAESGISLFLQMAPMLAKNAEKEQEMLGVYDHMLYDIVHMWLTAYEGVDAQVAVEIASVVGEPMPQNREAKIAEILTLVTSVPPLITVGMAQAELAKLGYEFPADASDQVFLDAERLSNARANSDPYASRYRDEVENEEPVGTGVPTVPVPAPNGSPVGG